MVEALPERGRPMKRLPRKILTALARIWLTVRYRLLDQRYGRLVLEEIEGMPILVLPQVFNPVLLRSGAFMVRQLENAPGVGPTLARGGAVLDLGCGSGVGAVFAAREGASVTAIDINPEAVRCTRINALLNDLEERVEVLQGDLFEPVAGRRFELILFNPPFYQGVARNHLDRAWRGKRVFEGFSGGLGDALAPGGQAFLVLSSDGDGDRLLTLLCAAGFAVAEVGRRDFVNEVMTAYAVASKE